MIALKSMVPLQSAELRCPLECCFKGRYKLYGTDGQEDADAGRVSVMRAINGGGGFHGGVRFVGGVCAGLLCRDRRRFRGCSNSVVLAHLCSVVDVVFATV